MYVVIVLYLSHSVQGDILRAQSGFFYCCLKKKKNQQMKIIIESMQILLDVHIDVHSILTS